LVIIRLGAFPKAAQTIENKCHLETKLTLTIQFNRGKWSDHLKMNVDARQAMLPGNFPPTR
jgi:hypothetical protein